MQYTFTPTGNNDSVLTLSLLKQYIRQDLSVEDLKIQDLIDRCVELFQNTTGYIFRPGALELHFSIADNVAYQKRKKYTFANRFTQNNYEYSDFYLTPLGANISTQKPSKLAFSYDDGQKERVLTQGQITDLVPDNFFIVRDKFPLIFKISRDTNDLQSQLQFDRFVVQNTITCTLNVETIIVPADVKGAIVRMCSALYENPDIDVSFADDSYISSVFNHYNCTLGL